MDHFSLNNAPPPVANVEVDAEIKFDQEWVKELFADTEGTCFLCLKDYSSEQANLDDSDNCDVICAREREKITEVCLRNVCRYLKINPCSILLTSMKGRSVMQREKEDERMKGERLEFQRKNRCDFIVTLCSNCSSLTESLSLLIRQVEAAQMMMHHKLQVFHRILKASFQVQPDGQDLWKTLEDKILKTAGVFNPQVESLLVENLRQMTKKQCSSKIARIKAASVPIVLLEKLTTKDTIPIIPHNDRCRERSESPELINIVSSVTSVMTPTAVSHDPYFSASGRKMIQKFFQELFVDTKGTCFLCLKEGTLEPDSFGDFDTNESQGMTEVCLRSICQYLKINSCSIFLASWIGENVLSMGLKKKMKQEEESDFQMKNKCNFTVTMCSSCCSLTESLSLLIRQVERTKMTMHHQLKIFHQILMEVQSDDHDLWKALENKILRNTDICKPEFELLLLDNLRQKTREKCSSKIASIQSTRVPKVLLQRLKTNDTKRVSAASNNGIIRNLRERSEIPLVLLDTDSSVTSNSILMPSTVPVSQEFCTTSFDTRLVQNLFQQHCRPTKKDNSVCYSCSICNFVSKSKLLPLMRSHLLQHPEKVFSRLKLPVISEADFKLVCLTELETALMEARKLGRKLKHRGLGTSCSVCVCTLCHKRLSQRADIFKLHHVMKHYREFERALVLEQNQVLQGSSKMEVKSDCNNHLINNQLVSDASNSLTIFEQPAQAISSQDMNTGSDYYSPSRIATSQKLARIVSKFTEELPPEQNKQLCNVRCLICSRVCIARCIRGHFVASHLEIIFAEKKLKTVSDAEFQEVCKEFLIKESSQVSKMTISTTQQDLSGKSKKLIPCPHCNALCRNLYSLRLHLVLKHFDVMLDKLETFQSQKQCTWIINNNNNSFKSHDVTVTNRKPWSCKSISGGCGRSFSTRYELIIHQNRSCRSLQRKKLLGLTKVTGVIVKEEAEEHSPQIEINLVDETIPKKKRETYSQKIARLKAAEVSPNDVGIHDTSSIPFTSAVASSAVSSVVRDISSTSHNFSPDLGRQRMTNFLEAHCIATKTSTCPSSPTSKKPFYPCPFCNYVSLSQEPSKLRYHLVSLHPERVFSYKKLRSISETDFKQCYDTVLQLEASEAKRRAENEDVSTLLTKTGKCNFRCTLCTHRFYSHAGIYKFHYIMEHYEEFQGKLVLQQRQFLQGSNMKVENDLNNHLNNNPLSDNSESLKILEPPPPVLDVSTSPNLKSDFHAPLIISSSKEIKELSRVVSKFTEKLPPEQNKRFCDVRCLICNQVYTSSRIRSHFVAFHPEVIFSDMRPEKFTEIQFQEVCKEFLIKESSQASKMTVSTAASYQQDRIGKSRKLVSCSHCNALCQNGYSLRLHLIAEHFEMTKERLERYMEEKNHTVNRPRPFKTLQVSSTSRKPWHCKVIGGGCGKKFSTRHDLIIHQNLNCTASKLKNKNLPVSYMTAREDSSTVGGKVNDRPVFQKIEDESPSAFLSGGSSVDAVVHVTEDNGKWNHSEETPQRHLGHNSSFIKEEEEEMEVDSTIFNNMVVTVFNNVSSSEVKSEFADILPDIL